MRSRLCARRGTRVSGCPRRLGCRSRLTCTCPSGSFLWMSSIPRVGVGRFASSITRWSCNPGPQSAVARSAGVRRVLIGRSAACVAGLPPTNCRSARSADLRTPADLRTADCGLEMSPRRMTAVLLALGTALCYGLSQLPRPAHQPRVADHRRPRRRSVRRPHRQRDRRRRHGRAGSAARGHRRGIARRRRQRGWAVLLLRGGVERAVVDRHADRLGRGCGAGAGRGRDGRRARRGGRGRDRARDRRRRAGGAAAERGRGRGQRSAPHGRARVARRGRVRHLSHRAQAGVVRGRLLGRPRLPRVAARPAGRRRRDRPQRRAGEPARPTEGRAARPTALRRNDALRVRDAARAAVGRVGDRVAEPGRHGHARACLPARAVVAGAVGWGRRRADGGGACCRSSSSVRGPQSAVRRGPQRADRQICSCVPSTASELPL